MSAGAPALRQPFTVAAPTMGKDALEQQSLQSAHPYRGALHRVGVVHRGEESPATDAPADRLVTALIILIQEASRNRRAGGPRQDTREVVHEDAASTRR